MQITFYIAALLLALLIGWDCAKPLKNHPGYFYCGALVLDALPFVFEFLGVREGLLGGVSGLMETGALAFFMFCIVMFTGCFKVGSKPRLRLKQVRQPLALTSCILACGHIAWIVFAWGPKVETLGVVFVVISAVVAILLAILGTTSVLKIQDVLDDGKLGLVHKLAYPFFVLLCVHASAIYLIRGGWLIAVLYLGICFAYVALRIRAR